MENSQAVQERREVERHPLHTRATFGVATSDGAYSPILRFDGEIMDLGPKGMKVKLRNVSSSQYRALLKGAQFCQVEGDLPGVEAETSLTGRVAWMEHADRAHDPECHVGVAFESLNPNARFALDQALDLLRDGGIELL